MRLPDDVETHDLEVFFSFDSGPLAGTLEKTVRVAMKQKTK